MTTYSNDPRMIRAKFDSTCAETGKPIEQGDYCVYYPSACKVYHVESDQAQSFREWKADIEMMNQNY